MSCFEFDVFVELVEFVGWVGGVFGLWMTGGGFGGFIVMLVDSVCVEFIVEFLSVSY